MEFSRVFYNKRKGQYLSYGLMKESREHRSLRLLKNTLRGTAKTWNLFLTLTYDDDHIQNSTSEDFRVFMNNLKQFSRNKKSIKIKTQLKEFKYCRKIEFDSSGEREYNPHFHVLLDSRMWLKASKLRKWWGKGFIRLEKIGSKKKALVYIQKYFSKETENFRRWKGKHFSKSRNLRTGKTEWSFYGFMGTPYAIKLVKMTSEAVLNGYKIKAVLYQWSLWVEKHFGSGYVFHSYIIACLEEYEYNIDYG